MKDKIRNKAEEFMGAAKRKAGEATDDDELRANGRAEEGKAKGKQAADRAAEAGRDAKESMQDKARQAMNRDQ
jgi:colicin import membrane protein